MLYALIIIAAIILVIVALAASRPNDFRIERHIDIAAPAETIHPHINDFHNWAAWSPWEKLDPNLQRTYSGAPSGKGAVYEWTGNKKVGTGRMEIKDTQAPRLVNIALDFLKPFKASNTTDFTLVPSGSGTKVTWAMIGSSPFPMKVFGLFMNMDEAVGKDFAKGLESLKAVCEQRPAA